MNEIAKANWDLAIVWMEHAADKDTDINSTIAYTGLAELALKAAQFAVNNPELVAGLDMLPKPDANTPAPVGPTQGPRLWGATQ
jgi:hypothetical protein